MMFDERLECSSVAYIYILIRGGYGDFFFHLRTWFLRLYLDSRLRQSTCSHETHASSLVLLCYMRSNTLTTIPCTITHSYAEKSLGIWCLRHRAARLTSLVRLVRVKPRTRSSRAVPTMLVPSMSPAQGHMQVCVIVRAPGAARGADSLRTCSGNMPGLAAGYGRAPGHAHLEMGSAATSSRARDGAPAQMASNGTRSRDASQ